MAVRIRLRRTGKRNAPCHRIVVADSRSPRDGRFIENIGIYDPRQRTEHIDLERANYWLGCGAIPSETVDAIIKRARAGIPMGHQKEEKTVDAAAVAETVESEAGTDTAEPVTTADIPVESDSAGEDKEAAAESKE